MSEYEWQVWFKTDGLSVLVHGPNYRPGRAS